ncbi:hypothetical protein T492DRAFT_85475 [Pavlovales sp. CCMP2436]|nr:hypothetical protein T492DRAFT_85475 [Pavlovales sp. CCMP2436]
MCNVRGEALAASLITFFLLTERKSWQTSARMGGGCSPEEEAGKRVHFAVVRSQLNAGVNQRVRHLS